MQRITLIEGALLAVIVGVFLAPTPALAGDARCIRLNTSDINPYYEYNPATNALNTLTLNVGETINWMSRSPDGAAMVIGLATGDKGVEVLRFVELTSQSSTDIPMEDRSSSVTIIGETTIGWSPDSQLFALPTSGFEPGSDKMMIFARDGSLKGQVLFDVSGGMSTWAWSPNSDQIAMSQSNPESAGDSSLITFLSLSGGMINTTLGRPVSDLSSLIWSPDGTSVAVTDFMNVYVIDSRTGAATTAVQNVFVSDPSLDLVWSSDGKALLVMTNGDQSDFNPYNVGRYTVSDQRSEIVMEGVGAVFSANPYTVYGGLSANGTLLVNQVNNGSITYFLVDARTGTSRRLHQVEDQGTNYNAGYIWSPSMEALWLTTDPAIVIRPDTMTQFKLPAGIYVDGASLSGSWSENGDWTVVGSMQEGLPFTIWAINTRTGASRKITTENPPFSIIPGNSGSVVLYDPYSFGTAVNSANGGDTVITDRLATLSNSGPSTVWSPDGSRLAFLEDSAEETAGILKVVQPNGSLISIEIPTLPYMVTSLEWVPCL